MSKSKNIPIRIPEGEAILDQLEFTMEDYSNACKKMGHEYRRLIKFMLYELGVKDYAKILEIGPGPGWIGIWLAQENPTLDITGIEISEDMIRVANKNKEKEGVGENLRYILGDAKNMHVFDDNTFDLVFSNGSLHHWDNPIHVFNEIKRILKNKGLFCIADGRRDLAVAAKIIFHTFKLFIPKFMRLGWKSSILAGYTPIELEEILDNSDLKDIYTIKADLFDFIIHNK